MLQYFAHLKVAYKLALGFGLIFVLMCSILAVDSYASSRQAAITQHLVSHLYPERKLAHEIKLLTYQADDDAVSYVISDHPNQAASYLRAYTTDVAQLRTTVQRAQALSETLTQRTGLDRFFTFYFGTGGYNEERLSVFREKQAGQFRVAEDDLLDEVSLSTALAFADRQMQSIEKVVAQEEASEQSFAQLVLILNLSLGGLTILLGVGIAFVMVRSITRPLQQVQHAIHQISTCEIAELNNCLTALAQGDLTRTMQAGSPPPLYTSHDEIGQTAQAVRTIMTDIHHTVEGYEVARLELQRLYGHLAEQNQALSSANARLEQLSTTDPLTGLPNHRAFMEQFSKELSRARRHGRPLSLLFFDADHFKRVNDTYGHAAGDAVLCQISARAGSALRAGDTLGRFGGEEFVALLPEADSNEASVIAERLRATIAAEPVAASEVAGGITMTVSIGLSTHLVDGILEQELLSQADEAMYVAKRLGRNQVRTAQEARQIGGDVEVVAMLQQQAQFEAAQREGTTPEQLRETYTLKTVCSLLSLLERRDEGLSAHAHAVSDLATSTAQMMGLEPKVVFRTGIAALVHDIGKVAIPDRLLQTQDLLSSQEYALLQEHAEVGAQILEGSPFLCDLVPAVRHHHERWDGCGYPDQLKGEDIPLAARIIAVAEAYDFMQRGHHYQASRSPEEAMAELQRCAGSQFDPEIVRVLLRVLTQQQEEQHSRLQEVG